MVACMLMYGMCMQCYIGSSMCIYCVSCDDMKRQNFARFWFLMIILAHGEWIDLLV